jgi:hypothetical protein
MAVVYQGQFYLPEEESPRYVSVTDEQLDSVPYLRPLLNQRLKELPAIIRAEYGIEPTQNEILGQVWFTTSEALKDPVGYAKNQIQLVGEGFGQTNQITPDEKALINSTSSYLMSKNISTDEIQNVFNTGAQKGYAYVQRRDNPRDSFFKDFVRGALSAPGFSLALAYFLPGIGNAIGAQLTAANLITNAAISNAVGTAMASAALQIAQGANFEDAIKNATVNAIIQTGSPSVATEINKLVKIPAVSDAITSAGASALKTSVAGGSAADIERNMIGSIAGSATASAVDYKTEGNISAGRLAGATVGGAVTGGTEGALIGLSGEYAGQKAAEEAAKATEEKRLKDARSKMIASADTGTVTDTPSLSPVIVKATPEKPSITDTRVIVTGTPIFADSPRAANVKLPSGFAVMPIQLAEDKPPGSYYDIEQNAWLTPVTPAPSAPVAQPSLPTTTVTGKAEPGITDTSIITPTGPISDREVMGAMQPSVPTPSTSTPSLGEVEVRGKRELGETSILSPDPSLSTVTVRGEREIESLPEVTVKGEREVDDTLSEVTVKGEREEEPQVPEEEEPTDEKGKPYRPNLFVYGGTKPSTLSRTLGTSVENVPTPSTTTGTSVGLGGRGEIESKESGKKRKTVWNEESLRLKDALGL